MLLVAYVKIYFFDIRLKIVVELNMVYQKGQVILIYLKQGHQGSCNIQLIYYYILTQM